jgi:O-antigen ligase
LKNIEIYQKGYYFLLAAFLICLPFQVPHLQITSIITILLVIWRLVFFGISFTIQPIVKKMLWLCLAYYAVYLVGVTYSNNQNEAWALVERYISFVVFPLVIFTSPAPSAKNIERLFLYYVASCCISLCVALIYATYQYLYYRQTNYFFYHPLANSVGMHGTFFAIYTCFSLFVSIYFLSKNRKLYWVLGVIFSALGVYLLSSRTQQVAVLILILAIGIYQAYAKRNINIALSCLSVIILAAALFWHNPGAKQRNQADKDKNGNDHKLSSAYFRKNRWQASFEAIKSNFIFGVGSGDVQDEIDAVCVRNNTASTQIQGYNTHNQFLQVWVGTGIIGIILLLLIIYQGVQIAIIKENKLYIYFIVIFVLSCMTEVVLEAQKGLIWFSLFNSLLIIYPKANE